VLIQPAAKIINNLAQGAWIGFDNYINTEATLVPELLDDYNYNYNNYTPERFIREKGLVDEFNKFKPSDTNKDITDKYLAFLVENKYYSQYLWWGLKGSCVYRYIGWTVMKNYYL
jgi:hypothetical protein